MFSEYEDLRRQPSMIVSMACGLILNVGEDRGRHIDPNMVRAAHTMLEKAQRHPAVDYVMSDEDRALWDLVVACCVDEDGVFDKAKGEA